MDIVAIQTDIAWEDKPRNFGRVDDLLARAVVPAGALAVLPEMFATGFTMNAAAAAEPPEGDTEVLLAHLARQYRCTVAGGLVSRSVACGPARNEAVAFGPDGALRARYAKRRLFSPAGEQEVYSPGDRPAFFAWGRFRAALFICYDLRFPELFREAAREGADLFVVIANWPARRQAHWSALLRARAIENQACAVGVNRCGADPTHRYAGGSLIVDAQGETLAEAAAAPVALRAALDHRAVAEYRAAFPALRDAGLLP